MKKIKLSLKRYIILILALFISSLYFNILQYPNKIVTGGLGGLSIIITKYFNIEPSQIIFIISIILLILSSIFLGIDKTKGAIISTMIYPIFIDITKDLNIMITTNLLITSIILGILLGITSSMVYKAGFSNGGVAIVSEIISKYTKIPLSKTIFIINFSIVLIGGISIGLEKLFYSTIILLINSLIISKVFKINNSLFCSIKH